MINTKFTKKTAFTLSEVLITLGIIGVVSALTIPSLTVNYQRQANSVQLHKIYTEMSQALELIIVEEGKTKLTSTSISTDTGKFLKTYFKIVNDCGTSLTPCFNGSYIAPNGAASAACGGSVITLASGAAVCFKAPAVATAGAVSVDINGPKMPNVAGRDLFFFNVYHDGSIDEGVTPECKLDSTKCLLGEKPYASPQALRTANFANCLTSGKGCFGKILNDNWKINY